MTRPLTCCYPSFDSYPQNFDCEHPDKWAPVLTTHDKFHRHTNPDQPLYIPEFQAGSYDAWVSYLHR